MLVQDIMTRRVVAIGPDMPIRDATALMEQRGIRHFPIVEADGDGRERVTGVVSDRDLRTVGGSHPSARPGVRATDPVREVMSAPVVSAHPLDPVEEAAHVLRERRIGAMPVLDDDEGLIGIVTGIDFLDALVRMTVVGEAGSRIEIEVPNRPGALAALLGRIAERGVDVASVMTTRWDEDAVAFALRVGTIRPRELARDLEGDGAVVVWPRELR